MFSLMHPGAASFAWENAASWAPGPRHLPSMTFRLCTHRLGSRLQALAYGSWSDLIWRKGGDKGDVLKPNTDMVSGGDTTTACSRGSIGVHRQAQGRAVATRRHSDRSNNPTQPPRATRGGHLQVNLCDRCRLSQSPQHRPRPCADTARLDPHRRTLVTAVHRHGKAVASGRRCKLQQLPLTPSDSSNDHPLSPKSKKAIITLQAQ